MSESGEVKLGPSQGRRGLFCKRNLIIAGAAVFVIALALGLGLGLGLRDHGDDDDDNDGGNGSGGNEGPAPVPNNNTWYPEVAASWQIILSNPLELDTKNPESLTPDVDVWDIDMYTNSAEIIAAIQSLGKKVICYFSAGSYEDYRPDSKQFKSEDKGSELDGWPGEYWLNLSSPNVRSIMAARIKYASEKGCDAIDPDNVDGFQNDNGLDLTAADSVSFVKFLSIEAAKYNMSTGLKNAGDIIGNVIDYVHFSVNEQCVQYSECDTFAAFIKNSKPVFNIEYPDSAPSLTANVVNHYCSKSGDGEGSDSFSQVLKKMNLDGWVEFCNGTTANTTIDSTYSKDS